MSAELQDLLDEVEGAAVAWARNPSGVNAAGIISAGVFVHAAFGRLSEALDTAIREGHRLHKSGKYNGHWVLCACLWGMSGFESREAARAAHAAHLSAQRVRLLGHTEGSGE